MYERTCVQEARETAHLMHNVSSEKVLVHDFPWWQMISCLICAGSILLVSSIFTKEPAGPDDPRAEFDAAGLYDDAETCLKVFEALSANSSGARIARDMMRGLKECGIKWSALPPASLCRAKDHSPVTNQVCEGETMVSSQDPEAQPGATFAAVGAFGPAHGLINTPGPMMGPDCGGFVPGDEDTPLPDGVLLTPNHWPAEIVDSMAWSAQFFGAMQNS
ncbi:hypothetical protein VTK73DRAFT_1039 [Phialemonium thermophilum]|uniref:Uncharacterized protein n=1 Tax=Phialemonium thermophilum TaxID=223376 RepID=A0ABR3VTZ1_9PEZI